VETSQMIKPYAIVIRYFLLMLLMLFLTGTWLFLLHTSFNIESFTNYYVQKSVFGLLEVTTPHLFAMGTVIFILTHFLSLNKKNTPFENKLTLSLFSVMLISNFSGFLVTEQTTYFIWIKIISIILFFVFSFLTMWRVFYRL
jgi:hypothetical protein